MITPTTSICKTPAAYVDILLEIDLELTNAIRLHRTAKASEAYDARVFEYFKMTVLRCLPRHETFVETILSPRCKIFEGASCALGK
jgi:hypothetical protein